MKGGVGKKGIESDGTWFAAQCRFMMISYVVLVSSITKLTMSSWFLLRGLISKKAVFYGCFHFLGNDKMTCFVNKSTSIRMVMWASTGLEYGPIAGLFRIQIHIELG